MFEDLTHEKLDVLEELAEKGLISPEQVMAAVGLEGWIPFPFGPMSLEQFAIFAGHLGKENFRVIDLEVHEDGTGSGMLVINSDGVENCRNVLKSLF